MKTVALVGCAIGGATDWLDGYIARNYNQMVSVCVCVRERESECVCMCVYECV